MNWKRLHQRLRDPRGTEADLEEEVRSFYDAMEARRAERGLAPEEAHRMTRAAYGPPALPTRENTRPSQTLCAHSPPARESPASGFAP